jgi:hypothetical protein
MLELILVHGADLSEAGPHGDTLLLRTAPEDNLPVIQWVLAHGSSITDSKLSVKANRYTDLLTAARNAHFEKVPSVPVYRAGNRREECRVFGISSVQILPIL